MHIPFLKRLFFVIPFAFSGLDFAYAADSGDAKRPPASAASAAPKPADCQELLRFLGMAASLEEAVTLMWAEASRNGEIPDGKTLETFRSTLAPQFDEFGMGVAKRYGFDPNEVKKLADFLRTPLGRKLTAALADESKQDALGAMAEDLLSRISGELVTYLDRAAPSVP